MCESFSQFLDREGVSYCCRTTFDDNAITNAIEIYNGPRFLSFFIICGVLVILVFGYWRLESFHLKHCLLLIFSGAVHFMASNNDSGIRVFDMERFLLCRTFRFDWPVNVKFFYPSFPHLSTWHMHAHKLNNIVYEAISPPKVDFAILLYFYYLLLLRMQHTALSPDGKLLVVVGDNPEALLVDSTSGKVKCF